PLVAELGDAPPVQAERPAVRIDDAVRSDRIAEPQGWVAEHARQQAAEPALGGRPLEIDREAGDEAADQSWPEREPDQPRRDGEQRKAPRHEEPPVEGAVGGLT